MFRSHRGGWSAVRQALLVVVPVVLGATVLLTTADGPSPSTTRLEATQSSGSPLKLDAFVDAAASPSQGAPLADAVSSPTSIPEGGAAEAAPVIESMPAPPPTPAPAPAADETAGPATSPSPATQAERSSTTTTAVVASAAPTTTSTPTTRAAETTTTTTTAPAPVAAPTAARAGLTRTAGVEAEVVPLTNRDRTAAGLGALTRNSCLDAIASGYAEKMAGSGVLAHNSGAGPAIGGCRPNPTWGDNVGTAAPCDAALLEERWMASPSHRRNILTGAFQLVGIGAWTDAQGGCWVQVLFSS